MSGAGIIAYYGEGAETQFLIGNESKFVSDKIVPGDDVIPHPVNDQGVAMPGGTIRSLNYLEKITTPMPKAQAIDIFKARSRSVRSHFKRGLIKFGDVDLNNGVWETKFRYKLDVVGFPKGKTDPIDGGNLASTALREFSQEIGLGLNRENLVSLGGVPGGYTFYKYKLSDAEFAAIRRAIPIMNGSRVGELFDIRFVNTTTLMDENLNKKSSNAYDTMTKTKPVAVGTGTRSRKRKSRKSSTTKRR